MDEVQRNHVIGLCAASEENRDVVANSEFVLFEDCYPSKGPAAENPFLNSSNSTPNGNWTNKLLYGRVSARYADSYDVQPMHTFNSLGPSEVVAEDEQKNWVEVLDLNKHGSKLEPNRHDVLFAKGVGGCPQKRSYLCIIPKNIPYHNPMIPVAGELLPRSSATLDIMQNVAHTVRIEERRSRTAAMLAKAECDMSEEDMRSIERRFMTHYRGSVLDATKSSIKSAKVLSAEPHHSIQALEGRSLIPTRSDEQTIIAENAHEPSLPQYRATLSAPPVPDAVASHRASRPAEVRPTNDRPYGKAHHGPSGGRPHTRGPHRASRSTDTGFASDMNHLGLRTTQESLQSLTSSQTPGMYPARQARNSRPDNGVQAGKKRKRR
ncbi:uncharacterized protein RCC_08907 [Ramularia collo-cygni]|uniref:Uncharacterized protein n=1 Tax=Ramularia collo-cygni TaxID=112498 RepID=A0A2D3UYP1_9PEZI|nr:uncharacterized protein RCC_08907 [Ramularia collo-cygni]CZT23197.1 uncharacterized protein RCC_08907 [Ramularia collo-cygni]